MGRMVLGEGGKGPAIASRRGEQQRARIGIVEPDEKEVPAGALHSSTAMRRTAQ